MDRPDSVQGARFDGQASDFDRRAGLPPDAAAAVVDAIVEIAGLEAGSRVLDLGAGTGQRAMQFLERGFSCTALDESPAMLEVLREKAIARGLSPDTVVADAGKRWPMDDGAANLVFGSRSLHWLSPEHVCAEAFRVASREGCAILVGRVERSAEGARARIRSNMRDLLAAAGFEGRSGRASTRAITARLVDSGAAPIPPRAVAAWLVRSTPRAVIDAWHRKHGLAGQDVPASVKEGVLARTEAWAAEAFGDIDAPTESEEWYTLEGAVIAPPKRARP